MGDCCNQEENSSRQKISEKKDSRKSGKAMAIAGTVSSSAGILGSWQICHNICLGIIALLGMAGITINFFPLLFLTKITIQVWSAALLILLFSLVMYFKKRCFSPHLLLLNTGLLIAGMPFPSLNEYQAAFWVFGGGLAFVGFIFLIKEKISEGKITKKTLHKIGAVVIGIIVLFFIIMAVGTAVNALKFSSSGYSQPESLPETSSGSSETVSKPLSGSLSSLPEITLGTTANGDVAITLAPYWKGTNLFLEVSANTHSVDLSSIDLKKNTRLKFDQTQIAPLQAPELSGHHASGIIVFNPGKVLETFTIEITGVPKEILRTYSWPR